MGVEAFVAEASVIAFDVCVLSQSSWPDEVDLYAGAVGPGVECPTRELGAVVTDDHAGGTAGTGGAEDDFIQPVCTPQGTWTCPPGTQPNRSCMRAGTDGSGPVVSDAGGPRDAAVDYGLFDATACDCAIRADGALTMSWDCFVPSYGTGSPELGRCGVPEWWTSGCGLDVFTYNSTCTMTSQFLRRRPINRNGGLPPRCRRYRLVLTLSKTQTGPFRSTSERRYSRRSAWQRI